MSEKPSMPEFRVYVLKDLLINPPPEPRAELTTGLGAALLALLVPKLIEAAITGVATALKKAGEKETKQLTAGEFCDLDVSVDKKDKEGKEIQVLSLNPGLGCVLCVWFQDPPPKNPPPDDEVVQKLKKKEFVPPKALVGGVFEAAIRRAPDDTAFFLDTRHFSVRHFVGDRSKDERDYEKLYQEELQAKKEFLEAEKASKADPTNEVLKVALEIARQKHDWQTKLRKAAGLPDRP